MSIDIKPVRTTAERDQFIRFQLQHYAGDANYVPPIIAERRDFLDAKKNPFLWHAELEMFIATRDGRVVGRIASINDPHYNQFHDTEIGFFGMFESVDDVAVANRLFEVAADWIKSKGMKHLWGPVNFSFNHDCGLLVEGFEHPPAMMMPYNHRYYAALFESNGFKKAKDLWSFDLSTSTPPPEKVLRVAERAKQTDGVKIRSLNMGDLMGDIRKIKSIYNQMLEQDWSFVPMSEEEFDLTVNRLRPLVQLRPELCFIAEVQDEPVAFSVTLPDSNIALKAANGQLTSYGFPVGLAKMAWAARSIDSLRVLLLGIKPGYRRRGLDALLYLETMKAARALGYTRGELGWTAEDNQLINRAIESMGARKYKTYRLYERAL